MPTRRGVAIPLNTQGGQFLQLVHLFGMMYSADAAMRQSARQLRLTQQSHRPGSGGHNQTLRRSTKPKLKPAEYWTHTDWGRMISDSRTADPHTMEHKDFETEFRIPYAVFDEAVQSCEGEDWTRSSTRSGKKTRGKPCIPLEFKVLACFYRLGAGGIARTTSRTFNISRSLSQRFFKDFCAHYAQKYHETCRVPSTESEMRHIEDVYARMGFPGCLGALNTEHFVQLHVLVSCECDHDIC